jgi:tRNA threonylcarbamoyladenosine biosynthesis protein TsaB
MDARDSDMNLLAIDTATPVLSIALETEKGVFAFEADAGQQHSGLLMDALDMLIKTANLAPGKLEGVVCLKGPGSFTGLRIGFATAKGLALSLGIPFASVPTLDCMAEPFPVWPGIVLPLIDAKKSCFFAALYRGGERISGYLDAGPPEISAAALKALAEAPEDERRLLLTGPDAGMFLQRLNAPPGHGDSSEKPAAPPLFPMDLCRLDPDFRRGRARDLLVIAKKVNIFDTMKEEVFSGPEYIRKSDAELSLYSV